MHGLKKLPIGISTIRTILEEGYLYVDKTQLVLDLIENGQYYFLSRPRRFGKSLLLDTFRSIFSGDKALFQGLAIEHRYDFKPYPVIYISFAAGDLKSKEELADKWDELLAENEEKLDVNCHSTVYDRRCFSQLIRLAYKKYGQKVVILVDEYDKPILDNIDNTAVATEMRDSLKNFYSVIKGSDEYIKFVFITGVSKFSKVSLFSGLNNLEDITLTPRYATLCGYTQRDLETTFADHLKGQDFAKIKHWYNGYQFLGEGVYNPFDILLFISNEFSYRNYWFSTATPTFLLKLIEKHGYFLPDLEQVLQDEAMLNSFDVDRIELEPLMWQTGYLTISKDVDTYDGKEYHLTIPNHEVRVSLMSHIADFLSGISNARRSKNEIYEGLVNSDFVKLETAIKALFAAIPYQLYVNNPMFQREGYYVSVFYAYIKSMGFPISVEESTNHGRIDMVIHYPNSIYVLEFKLDDSDALAQIKAMNYHQRYLDQEKSVYLLGLNFDTTARNLSHLAWEKVK